MEEINLLESQELNSPNDAMDIEKPTYLGPKSWLWWPCMMLCTLLYVFGQSSFILLAKFYYEKVGNSIYMVMILIHSTRLTMLLVLIFIFYYNSRQTHYTTIKTRMANSPHHYLSLVLLMAACDMYYSWGLFYLPVSTFTMLCETQLAVIFVSYYFFLWKSGSFILDSVVFLAFAAASVLAVNITLGETNSTKMEYIYGVINTIVTSVCHSLWVSHMKCSFPRLRSRRETIAILLEMLLFLSLVVICACLSGLLISWEWEGLEGEMEKFGEGKVSYVMMLVLMAGSFLISSIGSVGLAFEGSLLGSRAFRHTFCLPVVPILYLIISHESLNHVKVVAAMCLAFLGSVSYYYRRYIDHGTGNATVEKAEEKEVKKVEEELKAAA